MTVVVAFHCSDGVVVAADSMLTPFYAGQPIGHHNGQKIEILSGPQVYAFAGDQGQAARFRILAEGLHSKIDQAGHPIDYPIALTTSVIQEFKLTGIANMIDVNTVLAFPHGDTYQCCVFEGPLQPRLLDATHYYVSLGCGKLSADPFLRFLTDIFCVDGQQPTVREAIFLAAWTLQHVIETNPGGVAGPIKMAVYERNAAGELAARHLPITEISEHQQAIESARTKLRAWRDDIQSGEAAAEIPAPPLAPAPVIVATLAAPTLGPTAAPDANEAA